MKDKPSGGLGAAGGRFVYHPTQYRMMSTEDQNKPHPHDFLF